MIPRNAYTYSPEQHPNLIVGSLQLLCWMFFRPSAWNNHLTSIDPAFNRNAPRYSRFRWRNLALWRLFFQGFILLPILANIVRGLVLWGLGESFEEIVAQVARGLGFGIWYGLFFGMTFSVAYSLFFGVTFGIAFGVTLGMAFNVAFDMAFGVTFGIALGIVFGVLSLILGVTFGLMFGVYYSTVFGYGMEEGIVLSLKFGLAVGLGVKINSWRPLVFYPFVTVWNNFLYRLNLRFAQGNYSFLRWNCAFWDEWQYLPLQGLDKHIILVMERNPDEGMAAIEYLSTSRQRWAAQVAQIELDA